MVVVAVDKEEFELVVEDIEYAVESGGTAAGDSAGDDGKEKLGNEVCAGGCGALRRETATCVGLAY